MVQPEGFDDGSGRVCRLRKALYGLRKAPLWWFNTLSTCLHEIGFEPLSTDMCFFKCDRLSALLILYVDDLLIAALDKDTIKAVEDLLVNCFNLKALGEVHEFLGIQVERNREERNVFLHQKRYTERILEAFAATDLKPAKTPWDHKLSIPAVFDPDESRPTNTAGRLALSTISRLTLAPALPSRLADCQRPIRDRMKRTNVLSSTSSDI